MRWISRVALLAVLVGLGAPAASAGTVLAVDGVDIYVDLGADDGVGEGTELTLLHVIEARDPVTKKKLRDRFPVGTMTVTRAGARVCIARAPKSVFKRVKPGDEVELESNARTFVDPWTADAAPKARRVQKQPRRKPRNRDEAYARERADAQARVDAENAARAAWENSLGRSIPERILIWQEYETAYPGSSFSLQVRQEITSLRNQAKALERAEQEDTRGAQDTPSLFAELTGSLARLDARAVFGNLIATRLPYRVTAGSQLDWKFLVLRPEAVTGGVLHYRAAGESLYQTVELEAHGTHYLHGHMPAKAIREPQLQYYVSVRSPTGASHAELGGPEDPYTLAVAEPMVAALPDRTGRSHVRMYFDYVDFDGGGEKGHDQYFQAEVDFMYRFYEPIYSMRIGFGTIQGVGGPKDVIDEDDTNNCLNAAGEVECEDVILTYAYTEIEYRFSQLISVMIRPQFGTGSKDPTASGGRRCSSADNDGCEFFTSLGAMGRIRIGSETETNLSLGVGVTGSIGTVMEAAFYWDVLPRFPVLLTAQVTDQPVIDDFGVRLIGDVSWRSLDWFYPSVRLSYQARDIDHAGISAGLALHFDW